MSGIVWADLTAEERLAHIKPLWLVGKSAREICKTIDGVSRSAIIGYIHRNGLNRNDGGITARIAGRASNTRIGKADRPAPNTGGARKVSALRAQARAFGETKVKPAYAISSNGAIIEKALDQAPRTAIKARAFEALKGCEPVPFGSGGCRWPVGGDGASMLACGAGRSRGSYCQAHAEMSASKWQPAAGQPIDPLKWAARR